MAAADYDILIEQGSTFVLPITWKDPSGTPINITNYSARMQIRRTVKATDVVLSLTSPSGEIQLGGTAGTIVVTISATATDALTIVRGVYDLELQSPTGVVTRLIQGVVTVSPEVTRE